MAVSSVKFLQTPLPSERGVFSGKLLNAQRRKKQADYDITLLNNRIKMLKKEEEKAMKKISQTKDRASEILRIREENDTKMENLKIYQAMEELEMDKIRQQNLHLSEIARNSRMKKVYALTKKKKEDVQNFRKEKQQIKVGVQLMRQQQIDVKKIRREEIRKQEEMGKRKRELATQKIIERNRIAYETKLIIQEEAAKKRERDVCKMEKQEMELIQKLKNTQILQKSAFQDLEQALRTNNKNNAAKKTQVVGDR